MKIRLLLLLSLAALAACSQTAAPPPTRLSGTNSVVASGSLLFVTSSRSNEIRVLDLEPRPGLPRDFVRAPNPLAPLSIPTVPSPVELSTPTRYGPLGQPLQGDWLFARGAGSPTVSVIGAVNCPQQLREFGRIAPRPDSVVTALASRLTSDDLQAQLYFATFDGTNSTLWEVLLPNQTRGRLATPLSLPDGGTADPCPRYPQSMPLYVIRPLGLISDEVVTAMLALPTVQHPGKPADPEERRIVVATRLISSTFPDDAGTGDGGAPAEQGMVRVYDPTPSGLVTTSPPAGAVFNPDVSSSLSFPVKRLVTLGNVVQIFSGGGQVAINPDGTIDGGSESVVMDAGTRVFAVMDEASCRGSLDCVGVLAVDLDRLSADGGWMPVAIDGWDNSRDLIDDAGVVIRQADGTPVQYADTFYRAPEHFDGGVLRDANRMLPMRFGNSHAVGIIQDIAIQSNGVALYLSGSLIQYGLLGFVTISGYGGYTPPAQIFAFDGMTLRQINFAPNASGVTLQQAVLNNGGQAIFDGGPREIAVDPGIWPYSESVYVLYEGSVASIFREPLDAGLGNPAAGLWPVSVNTRNLVELGFVEPGDIIVPTDQTGSECIYGFPIIPVADGGLLDNSTGAPSFRSLDQALSDVLDDARTLYVIGPDGGPQNANPLLFPDGGFVTIAECPAPSTYTLRSSGVSQHGFTVTGTLSGFLGRIALPSATVPTTVFAKGEDSVPQFLRVWRPSVDAGTSAASLGRDGLSFRLHSQLAGGEGFVPGVEPVLLGGDIPGLRGSGYRFDFLNGYTPASVAVSSTSLGIGGLNLPGALALYQREIYPLGQTAGSDRVFVLYPAGNVILDFAPTTAAFGQNNTVDIGLHY